MRVTQNRLLILEQLAQLMEELCAPELTLGQASVLRPQVARLVQAIHETDDRQSSAACLDVAQAGQATAIVEASFHAQISEAGLN